MEGGGQNKSKYAPKRIKYQEIVEEGKKIESVRCQIVCLLKSSLDYPPQNAPLEQVHSPSDGNNFGLCFLLSFLQILIFNRKLSDFVSFVDKTLTQCRQLKLNKFVVSTGYHAGYESQFNNWLRYAITCNVEELNLALWGVDWEAEFPLDQFFFFSSCFIDLRLTYCVINPTGPISWKNLRSLSISCMKLDEDVIENILNGSPLLETLELSCGGYRRLNITSKSVKNLVFYGYVVLDEDHKAYIIEIYAPNILSLTIKGDYLIWKVLLVDVSSLVEANLDYTNDEFWEATSEEAEEEMLEGFILNLRHVIDLKIGAACSKVVSRLEAKGFVFPSNITLPDITYDWSESESESDGDSDSVESGAR